MARPKQSRADRKADREAKFASQHEARQRVGAPGGVPGQPVLFNPNPPTAQPAGVSFKVTHHTEAGDVPIDPNLAQAQARQIQGQPAGQLPAQAQQAPQPGQPVPQPPPGMGPQQPQIGGPPVQGHPGQQSGQVVAYGASSMPVTQGEVAPSSAPAPNSTAPGHPSATVAPGMAPSHMQATPGMFAPGMSVQGVQGGVSAGPLQAVVEQVEAPAEGEGEPLDVTIVLTSWMRPGLVRGQFMAIAQQSRAPAQMAIYVNPPPVSQPGVSVLDEEILANMINWRNSVNDGPWPRFYKAFELSTEYVVILDDDVIPGPSWLEQAIALVDEKSVCVAVTGALIDADGNEQIIGPGTEADQTTVDFGRQGWVIKREWLTNFLRFPRVGHRNYGWGIHMAAALQSVGIDTVVLPYKNDDQETWGTLQPEQTDGLRNVADAAEIRADVFKAYQDAGWSLLSEGE